MVKSMAKKMSYWRRREEEALQHYITEEAEYDRRIQQIYKTMLANIQTEIDAFYGRYASKEGITLQEAKKRVSEADIEAYARKAKDYVARKDLSDIANEEMRLYNLKMKVNRLEMLKARIGMEVTAGTDEMNKHMGAVLKKRVYDELKRQAGILGHTVVNNEKLAHEIPNASFHGATFSERLWRQDKQMMEDLSRLLQSGLIRGKNPRVLAREIRRYFIGDTRLKNSGGVIFNAERLMRTELARVQTAAQKASFEANGFTQYEYIANSRCCEACQALDGKHFDVADMMPGENAAPLHPNCRCSVAAYDDGEEYQRWLKEVEAEEQEQKLQSLKTDIDYQERIKQRRAAYRERERNRSVTPSVYDFSSMTREELLNYAKKNLKTDIGDLKGVNIDFARESIRVISEFEQRLGGNTIPGLKIKFGGLSKNVYAKYDDGTNTVLLKRMGSKEAFEKSQKEENLRYRLKWKTDKDYYATETYSGTIWHELGHAIDIHAGQQLSRRLSSTAELDALSVKVSAYAGTTGGVRVSKRSEAWAENFAAYMDGGANKGKVPKAISDMIENCFTNLRGSKDVESMKKRFQKWSKEVEGTDGEHERPYIRATKKDEPGSVNRALVNTAKYHDKYSSLSGHKAVDEGLYKEAMEILSERNNTEYEDVVAIDARTGTRLVKNTSAAQCRKKHMCGFTKEECETLEGTGNYYEVLHNHPNSSIPSRDDIRKLFERHHQKSSVICCHNGDVYRIEKLKPYENIANLEETVYNKMRTEYSGFADDKIEFECSEEMTRLLSRAGCIQYTRR